MPFAGIRVRGGRMNVPGDSLGAGCFDPLCQAQVVNRVLRCAPECRSWSSREEAVQAGLQRSTEGWARATSAGADSADRDRRRRHCHLSDTRQQAVLMRSGSSSTVILPSAFRSNDMSRATMVSGVRAEYVGTERPLMIVCA